MSEERRLARERCIRCTVNGLEGAWRNQRCVLDVNELKAEMGMGLPYPSEATGNSFEEAKVKLGIMRVLWDFEQNVHVAASVSVRLIEVVIAAAAGAGLQMVLPLPPHLYLLLENHFRRFSWFKSYQESHHWTELLQKLQKLEENEDKIDFTYQRLHTLENKFEV
ncbi:nodulin homeobox-like isoform X1 [Quillaja saponaria]|uniref:Nodulin homeobox-like isoform X1 n=1 Tax=Quillaja saponaria TaxID=32244 RepID=A0AAD7P9Z7_QUISA|nr:nodulin homeobox-like isoform X1 [Quillaja saponaria]